jgi:hypothetical protein
MTEGEKVLGEFIPHPVHVYRHICFYRDTFMVPNLLFVHQFPNLASCVLSSLVKYTNVQLCLLAVCMPA